MEYEYPAKQEDKPIDWVAIATATLTFGTAVLTAINAITPDESKNLVTTGAAAITGVAAFGTAIAAVIRAHKKQ